MMPNDEEIINGSVLENEIFGNNLDDEMSENLEVEDEIQNDIENENNNNYGEDVDEFVNVEIQ